MNKEKDITPTETEIHKTQKDGCKCKTQKDRQSTTKTEINTQRQQIKKDEHTATQIDRKTQKDR